MKGLWLYLEYISGLNKPTVKIKGLQKKNKSLCMTCFLRSSHQKNEYCLSPDLLCCVFQIIHQTGSDCLASFTASKRLLEERGGGLD